ncbi:GPO family capsid scaffolding protein [Metapseudomonas furukawaii]|uniref:Phage capsid scaffolding protein n=1 Tax=Metapseudomonas furukawaii TaxID=1149133 RepID=A0AAD1C0D4_METFU|nr:GPO family capsid scaffolding protein [Pseudomonas furukawaii]ELS26642.1 Phage capsid scaffolding protein [Pseudomonas furukawaii]BAU74400.1 phage capsid scaffolding protein [Pseudomonas furukawaii]
MKKYRSKWFRVAVEGATTDKRTIKRNWLEQAARNFNRSTYGARVWLEHLRSLLPDGPFRAYGDVLAVKAEEVEVNGERKLALFAQIEPTADLIALNKARQKIYASIELDENFADTGEAYLVGMAVTDSPASLGTDVLAFSAEKPEASPFRDRHYSATAMFSEAIEAELEFEEVSEAPGRFKELLDLVNGLVGRNKAKASQDDTQFAELGEALTGLLSFADEQSQAAAGTAQEVSVLKQQLTQLAQDFAALKQQLGESDDPGQPKRPPATGENGQILTDC